MPKSGNFSPAFLGSLTPAATFRKEVIKRFPLEYKNYKEGEVIDQSLIDLTYDKSVTRFPGACLDWNLLFDIVRPRA